MSSKILQIDCSPLAGPFDSVSENDFKKVANAIGEAMCGIGFCYLINHGVDTSKVEHIYKTSKEFFHLPVETKNKYRKPNPKKLFHGYAGPGDELLREENKNSTELREFWDTSKMCWKDEDALYPEKEIPGFKAAFDDITEDLDNFAKKLLRCLEIFLELEEGYFIKRHQNLGDSKKKSQTLSRSMYYYNLNPDQEIPPNAIRCGEHSDWCSMSLLFQDMVGGLEVETLNGEWLEAVPIKDSILLNVGQLMEIFTSGKLLAARHRVRITESHLLNTSEPRQSFIYFVSPDAEVEVSPQLPAIPGREKFASMKVNAHDYFQERMSAVASY